MLRLIEPKQLLNTAELPPGASPGEFHLEEEESAPSAPSVPRGASLSLVVGQNIRRRRKLWGLSQEELAQRVGINQQSLSRMEKGKLAPRFERLRALAEALHCTVPDLFRENAESPEENASLLADILRAMPPAVQRDMLRALASLAREAAADILTVCRQPAGEQEPQAASGRGRKQKTRPAGNIRALQL